MAWLLDWWFSICISRSKIQALRNEVKRLTLKAELLALERDSLDRQLESAIDTIQAFGIHNRTIGMEAKLYETDLNERAKAR